MRNINVAGYKINIVDCGTFRGRLVSDKLPGALKTGQMFSNDIRGNGSIISNYVGVDTSMNLDSDIKPDRENNFYIGSEGVVVDAFDLSGIDEFKIDEIVDAIIERSKDKYPEYNFSVIPGIFPLGVKNNKILYSTHMLCIKNYKDFIDEKQNVKCI